MGVFNKFFGSKSSKEPTTGPELLRLLLKVTQRGSYVQLEECCEKHADLIRASFPEWKTVPPEYREREAAESYFNMMLAVAQYFEEEGDSSLMEILDVNEANALFAGWEMALEDAGLLIQEGKNDEAIAMLKILEEELKTMIGSGSEIALAVLHVRKGLAYLGKGETAQARTSLMLGYKACQETRNINELAMAIQGLANLAKSEGKLEEERHWRIVVTNILLQVGEKENAIQVRKHFGIEPYDELIESTYVVES